MDQTNKMPEFSESYWTASARLPEFPQLKEDIDVDVVVVGGGIAGITSAYLLVQNGVKVALLEAGKLLQGTTGHTTAKVSAQHDVIYDEYLRNYGKKIARQYYDANCEAHEFIRNTVEQNGIDCQFTPDDAYLYATTDKGVKDLQAEAKAYKELGIGGELVDEIPLDLPIKKALVMRNQAHFHPLHYLSYLLQEITKKGGLLFENMTAVNIETGNHPRVLTDQGPSVRARYVLCCTHFPFYEGLGLYSARMYASRSYALAVKTKKKYPGGMYLNVETPSRSLRSVIIDGQEMVLIGGEGHKTGQGKPTSEYYKALEQFSEETFGIEEIPYRWSAQDLITLDNIPYIGSLTSGKPNILIATGFRKWGMTNGTAAAQLLTDLVLRRENPYRELYSPSRFHPYPSIKNFIKENADVVGELVKGKFEEPLTRMKELGKDEGALITIQGEKKGAYRDNDGKLHVVDTTCTHIGCEVRWNNGERTWDCPCHGSRFSYTGEVVEGPAEKPLQSYNFHMLDNATSEDSGY